MTSQREAVRSNAKYLHNVRPIDPEEICTYIEGEPHPAVVRQLLREEALDLGLIERDDGTFVPASEKPIPPRSPGIGDRKAVERLPDRYSNRLENLLVERYGVNWHEGPSGDLLRSTIRRFKAQYLERQAVTYDDDVAAGYALYHLPGYYAAIQYALDDLLERGLLDRQLRVLDIGAGTGGPALGLCDVLPADGLLEYHAVEPGAGADILEGFLEETGRNVHPTIHQEPIESFDPPIDERGFDLILVCNVLSELENPERTLRRALGWLEPDGSLLAMAPADKNASIELRELERTVEGDQIKPVFGGESHDNGTRPVTVYGPTVRLWPGESPSDRGWSFDVKPDLEVPPFQRRLQDGAGTSTDVDETDSDAGGMGDDQDTNTARTDEFINVDVQFSHTIFRLDGQRRHQGTLEGSARAKMADMGRHVTNRIDLTAAKLSHSLAEDGDAGPRGRTPNPLFKISDGSESVDHYAVLTRETSLNRGLLEADYGELLAFENVLVLWNDDEGAYNLVVDEETVVDRVG